jgi:KEOPS complex subunit Pcc1
MRGLAEIDFKAEDPNSVFEALLPEIEDEIYKSKISLSREKDAINLKLEGNDLSSMRASLNTWIRLIDIALEMVKI